MMTPSLLKVASREPSGLKRTPHTSSVWPRSTAMHRRGTATASGLHAWSAIRLSPDGGTVCVDGHCDTCIAATIGVHTLAQDNHCLCSYTHMYNTHARAHR
jgi:hypothetical protein